MNIVRVLAIVCVAFFGVACASVGNFVQEITPELENFGAEAGVSVDIKPDAIIDAITICIPADSVVAATPFIGEILVDVIGACAVEVPVEPQV